MKYYVVYSYSIDKENRSEIGSEIVNFKYCVESSQDLLYLRTELLMQLRKKKIAKEVDEENLFIINFYPLKESVDMPENPVKYLVTFSVEYDSLVIDRNFHRVFSRVMSRPTYLDTEGEMISLKNAIIDSMNTKNAGYYKVKDLAIINYVQLE